MRDFFISYNGQDKDWAEWIAWTLEEAGYTVFIQAWHFRPGENFILKMQEAAESCDKTIAVLSRNYLDARYTKQELAAALVQDPTGDERKLIPVRIGPCKLTGILSAIVYIDLVGLADEDARTALLGALSERAKPTTAPSFPGSESAGPTAPEDRIAPERKSYPGESHSKSVMSKLNLRQDTKVQAETRTLSTQEKYRLMERLHKLAP